MADVIENTEITEHEFFEKYRPLRTEHGDLRLFSPHAPEHQDAIDTAIAERRLWTYHHGEYDSVYFWSGPHFVNRLDYVICEVPFAEGADIITFDPDHQINWFCEWCNAEHFDITQERYDELGEGGPCGAEGCTGEPEED